MIVLNGKKYRQRNQACNEACALFGSIFSPQPVVSTFNVGYFKLLVFESVLCVQSNVVVFCTNHIFSSLHVEMHASRDKYCKFLSIDCQLNNGSLKQP